MGFRGLSTGGRTLRCEASLQPAATAIGEKLLLSPWQRGEAHFDPFRRGVRQGREFVTRFRFLG